MASSFIGLLFLAACFLVFDADAQRVASRSILHPRFRIQQSRLPGLVEDKLKVCVVGGGASGLVTVRHLSKNPKHFEITVFEQNNDIGGTWIYSELTSLDDGTSVHSSMYKNLRTNVPGHIMNFPDFVRMGNDEKPCPTHQEILQYLHDYQKEFDLGKYFQLNKKVENVSPDPRGKFNVRVKNVKSNQTEYHKCDSVIVCNGHYSKPFVPSIPGIESFRGTVLHSHNYRRPEEFEGKSVIILGASTSGIDIATELSGYASRIYISHNKKRLQGIPPSNVVETVGVQSVSNNTIVFKDGSTAVADIFLFCTGYEFDIPFMDKTTGLKVDGNFIYPLYKHIVNVNYPRIGFIGVPLGVLPFPTFHIQAQYYVSVLKNTTQLPNKTEMYQDAKLKTDRKKDGHVLGKAQWAYHEELARLGHFEPLPLRYRTGSDKWFAEQVEHPWTFKEHTFSVSKDGKNVTVA